MDNSRYHLCIRGCSLKYVVFIIHQSPGKQAVSANCLISKSLKQKNNLQGSNTQFQGILLISQILFQYLLFQHVMQWLLCIFLCNCITKSKNCLHNYMYIVTGAEWPTLRHKRKRPPCRPPQKTALDGPELQQLYTRQQGKSRPKKQRREIWHF